MKYTVITDENNRIIKMKCIKDPKYKCKCGSLVLLKNKPRHDRTKKHRLYIYEEGKAPTD